MKEEMSKLKRKDFIIDIIIFLICFCIFGLALLSFYPGLISSDGVDQINQAKNNSYVVAHPVAISFVIGNLAKLGGLWVPALFQIIVFSLTWTYGMKVLRKFNNANIVKVMQIVFTLFICILPINFLYSITLWKDILYSYAMLLTLVFIYIGIKKNWSYTIPEIIFISLANIEVMKFRLNGMPIGLIVFAGLLILNLFKEKKIKKTAVFIISFVVFYLVFSLPSMLWARKTETTSDSVLTSTKVCVLGAYLSNESVEMDKEDVEYLDTLLDVDFWRDNYCAFEGTTILFSEQYKTSPLKTSEEANKKLTNIFWKYTKKYPTVAAKHFIKVNSLWWSVHEYYPVYSIFTDNSGIEEISNGAYHTSPKLDGMNTAFKKYISVTWDNGVTFTYLYRPAVHIIISIVLLALIILKRKKLSYVLLLIPSLLNIGTYVILMSAQDLRYFYPSFLTGYFIFMVYVVEKFANNQEKMEVEKIEKENPKTLIIIPAYNEEGAIKKTVEAVYAENIPNLDVIVVNDGSKDKTYQEACKTKAIVIDLPHNLGIGGAVQTGYLYAEKNDYDIAIQVDGDGQHDPKYIIDLIEKVKEGNNLVIGSRFIKQSEYKQTFMRMLGINIISAVIKLGTNVKIYDTTSGFRAADRNVIKEFAKKYPYDYPEPCSTMHMLKKGYKVDEVSVEMKQRETGVSSISPLKSISYMCKVVLSLIIEQIIE